MAHKRNLMARALMAGARASSVCVCAVASLLVVASGVSVVRADGGAGNVGRMFEMSADGRRVIVRLRSFAPRASGRLEVEPTTGGGRVRLTALNLPTPQSLAPNARTFVAWASGGRILRLGELRRGARGTGSLVFMHPSEFSRYSLIVTAESDARAERPTGAPVFSTRANEVAALFPINEDFAREIARRERRAATRSDAPSPPTAAAARRRSTATTTATGETSTSPRTAAAAVAPAATTTALRIRDRASGTMAAGGEFFKEIDEAIKRDASARTLLLVGDRGARGARGTARVATEDGTAYVRVRFRRVPPASRFGRGRRYAMWALVPEDMSTIYMGSLPARNLNRRHTYARTQGVRSDKFRLLVTAERRTATPRPRGRRVLMTFKGRRRK